MSSVSSLRRIAAFALVCAAANVLILAVVSSYDVRFGPVHLAAHELFKPLLMLNGLLLLNLLAGVGGPVCSEARIGAPLGTGIVIALALAIYVPSFWINFQHHDWTHRHISADLPTAASLGRLFVETKADGFYRPLGFISLWVDYRVFHDALWGYHLQNVALHVMCSLLAGGLALALGYGSFAAFGAALLFAAAPTSFEPVVWPAARFDLLAAFFTLAAMIGALRYLREKGSWRWLGLALASFTAGVLSKESAYAFPVMLAALWFVGVNRTRWLLAVAGTAVLSLLLIAVRFGVYGGLGGYRSSTGASPHFALSWKTVAYLIARVPTLPVFEVNTTVGSAAWLRADVAAFAIFAIALAGMARLVKPDFAVLVLLIASAAPLANLIGWVGPSLINSRFLYLPSALMAVLLSAAIARTRRPALLLGALALICAIAALWNELAYAETIGRTTLMSY